MRQTKEPDQSPVSNSHQLIHKCEMANKLKCEFKPQSWGFKWNSNDVYCLLFYHVYDAFPYLTPSGKCSSQLMIKQLCYLACLFKLFFIFQLFRKSMQVSYIYIIIPSLSLFVCRHGHNCHNLLVIILACPYLSQPSCCHLSLPVIVCHSLPIIISVSLPATVSLSHIISV